MWTAGDEKLFVEYNLSVEERVRKKAAIFCFVSVILAAIVLIVFYVVYTMVTHSGVPPPSHTIPVVVDEG